MTLVACLTKEGIAGEWVGKREHAPTEVNNWKQSKDPSYGQMKMTGLQWTWEQVVCLMLTCCLSTPLYL